MVNSRICLFLFRLTESLEAKLSLPSRSSSSLRLNFDLWRGLLDSLRAPMVPSDRKTHVSCRRPSPVCSEQVKRNAARKLECWDRGRSQYAQQVFVVGRLCAAVPLNDNKSPGRCFGSIGSHTHTHTPLPPFAPLHFWLVFVRDR